MLYTIIVSGAEAEGGRRQGAVIHVDGGVVHGQDLPHGRRRRLLGDDYIILYMYTFIRLLYRYICNYICIYNIHTCVCIYIYIYYNIYIYMYVLLYIYML